MNNIFLDTDPDNSGYSTSGIGAEMLIQQGAGYEEKGGLFNEGPIEGLDFAMAPSGTNVDFELRIARTAKFGSDHLPVFVADTIKFFLETEDTNFATTDTAPDVGGLEYTFLPVTPTDLGSLAITATDGKLVITWSGPGTLQARNSLSAGSWANVPDAVSGIQITPSEAAQYYRLSL